MTVKELMKDIPRPLIPWAESEFANDELVNEKKVDSNVWHYDLSGHPEHLGSYYIILNAKGEKVPCFNIYKKEV